MTVTISFGNVTDGEVDSQGTSYAIAQAGTGLTLYTGYSTLTFGQSYQGTYYGGGTYYTFQSFLEFPYTLVSTDLITSAYFQFANANTSPGSPAIDGEVHEFDWGGSVTTADFRSPTQLSTALYLARLSNATLSTGDTNKYRTGRPALLTRLATTGIVRVVLCVSRQRTGPAPSTAGDNTSWQYGVIYAAEASGTTLDPCLVYTSVRKTTLSHVLGAAIQLSDGTDVYLESDGAATPILTIKSYDGTTASTIATVSTGTTTGTFGLPPSMQALALTRDVSDNLYLVGRDGAGTNTLLAQAFVKGVGLTWTAKTALSADMPSPSVDSRIINNVAAAWHPNGLNGAGTLMVLNSTSAYVGPDSAVSSATLRADSLKAGSGTLLINSTPYTFFLSLKTQTDYGYFPNETGTGLDVQASGNFGFVALYDSDNLVKAGIYSITASGAVTAPVPVTTDAITITKDANSKLRVIPINATAYAVVAGGKITVRNVSGILLGSGDFTSAALATFPTAATLRGTAAWDAFYDAASNKIWHYYFDVANNRRLMRTGYSLSTYACTAEEAQVSAAVGAVSTSNLAIRIPRMSSQERSVRVAVANLNVSTLSTVYIADTMNVAPNSPTLGAVASFDAMLAKFFTWTFSDPNALDGSTAYQLLIVRTSDSVQVYDSGKVTSTSSQHTLPASTLVNGTAYQWRVRTYDKNDAVGPYAPQGAFSTVAGGSVAITSPATDNLAGINTSSLAISWTVTGVVQTKYRLRLVRTSDGVQISDTGFLTSTATTATVVGMATGVEYRVEVTAQDALAASTSVGIRLITPNYSSPEAPTFSLTQSVSYVLVSVVNPAPTGSNPDVTLNQIYRRKAGDLSFVHVGDVGYNGSYQDYAVTSNVSYDYQVVGVA